MQNKIETIQVLRLFAAFSVMMVHLPLIEVGIWGVDIFFVISGYLITSFIISKKNDDGFSLIKFYERRARRLLPALFLVITVITPFDMLESILSLYFLDFEISSKSFAFSREMATCWVKAINRDSSSFVNLPPRLFKT